MAGWPVGKHLGAVPQGIPGAVTMLGCAWPLCFPFLPSMWGANVRWVRSCLAAEGRSSVRVPLWHRSSCHPRTPPELGLFNTFLLVVKPRLFITWISFCELLNVVYLCFQYTKLKSSWCCCCDRLLSGFIQSLGDLFADGRKEPFQYYFDFVFQVRLLR